jgi:hypothetical protein
VTKWHSSFSEETRFVSTNSQYPNQVILSKVLGIDNPEYTKYCRERTSF